jgi:serine/threonine protein kinase
LGGGAHWGRETSWGSIMGTSSSRRRGLSGKYRPLLALGEGGSADVYLAVAHGPADFNKLVVLKVLKTYLAEEPEYREMFISEARLCAQLSHPNIVQVNEVLDEKVPMMVMEYLEGMPLSQVLGKAWSELPLELHLHIISEMLKGLHYSHELRDLSGKTLNVIHRDVTPHNVFITWDGSVKILDFGIAKLAGASGHTRTGVIKGKIPYMAPEQIKADANLNCRADVYSAGVLLWEAAARQRRWKGLTEAVIMNRVLSGDLTSPSSVDPEIHPKLEQTIVKAVAPNPQDRHATAAELQAEVEEVIRELAGSVSDRDVAHWIAERFGEHRAKVRKAIAARLNDTTPYSDHAFTKSTTGTRSAATATPALPEAALGAPARKRSRLGLAIAACSVALTAAAGGLALHTRASATPRAVTGAAQAHFEAAEPLAAAERAELNVTAFPATAAILLDGKPLDGNPVVQSVEDDGKQHVLRALAPGHQPETRRVRFDRDLSIVMVLQPEQSDQPVASAEEPSAEPRARSWRRAAPRVAPVKPEAPAPAPATQRAPSGCSVPYFIDSSGIKRFRPECL